MPKNLINFLQQELLIPCESIILATHRSSPLSDNLTQFPIILWQYGLITREQLDEIFDWFEVNSE